MDENFGHNSFDLASLSWIAVDTETTGINPWKYEIIEIGAVKFNLTTVLEKFQIIIIPEKKQDPKSKAIHKIEDREIKESGVEAKIAMVKFLDFIQDYPLIFHNASFDLSFLSLAAEKYKLNFNSNYYYDTLYLLRTYKPDLESYSLQYLRNHLEIDSVSHRALSDAEATSHVFQWILNDNLEKINSKKHLKTFLKYHRKLNTFKVTLPTNLDKIFSYFNKFIKTKTILKISKCENGDTRNTVYKNIIPIEIMIFNQKLLLKCSMYPDEYVTLIPLSEITIFDPEKGPIQLDNI